MLTRYLPLVVVACVPSQSSRPTANPAGSSCAITKGCSGFLEANGTFTFYLGRPAGPEHDRLVLATPWNTRASAVRLRNGYHVELWQFQVDWNGDVDASTIAKPWEISSREIGLVAQWSPNTNDVALAQKFLEQTSQEVIVGATPAQVVSTGVTIDEAAIVVGGSSTVRVTVENTGGSTAVGVSVKTRSSLPELHNLTFDFGNIRPGRRASKSVTVNVPAETRGDSATLVVSFSEAEGKAPADVTQKLPFKKSQCPEGRFTRERYNKKRAKLQQALDDGSMSQAEFDSYDAELVRCLD